MDIMLPTLHEADTEHETAMHGDHAHKGNTAVKRVRPDDHDNELPSHAASPPDADDGAFMEAHEGGAELDVQSPPELPENESIPLLETQARQTQTQILEEHITQATADVYTALHQLHSEQVSPTASAVPQ